MNTFKSVFVAVLSLSLFSTVASAQDTNDIKTKLEFFEAQTGIVLVIGTGQIGTVSANGGTIAVNVIEAQDVSANHKEYGVSVEISGNAGLLDTTVIDSDELTQFIDGLDYISKVNFNVTTLPTLNANYTTRGGLRVAAFSSNRRPGSIQHLMRGPHVPGLRISFLPDQLVQFQNLVTQARTQLDALRAGK